MQEAQGYTKHELETRLIERCWKDPEFKAAVLADPKGSFESFLGTKLPADLRIVIREDDAHTLHFNLPPAPDNAVELSDEELERIAGGTDPVDVTIVVVATVAVTVNMIEKLHPQW